MTDSPREQLAELVRLFEARVDWERELGRTMLPRSVDRALPALPTVAARPTSPPVTSDRVSDPPPKFEVPAFLRRGSVPPARPSAPPASRAIDSVVPEPPLFEDPKPARPKSVDDVDLAKPPEGEERLRVLRVIQDEAATCTACGLHEGRTKSVFSRGDPFASLVFVGEGPGRDEDLTGFPFVGEAGRLLDKMIGAMGMAQNEVYICNVVKCRPPNNRVPAPDEMETCGPFLSRQLSALRPSVIVSLGKTATAYLLDTKQSMTTLRGNWQQWKGIPVMPTWHPAFLLRQPDAKRTAWDDLKKVLARLGRGVPSRG